MPTSRVPVVSLSQAELDKLNAKKCPKCDHELRVTILGGVPQVWTCDNCRTEYSTAAR